MHQNMAWLKVLEQGNGQRTKKLLQLLLMAHPATPHPTQAKASPLCPTLKESLTLLPQFLQSPPGSSHPLWAIILLSPSCTGSLVTTGQSRLKCNFCTALGNLISRHMNLDCCFGKNNLVPDFSQFVFTALMLQGLCWPLRTTPLRLENGFAAGCPLACPLKSSLARSFWFCK